MVNRTQNSELSEISAAIGELRNFATQQIITNQHVLDQLKSISDRINNIGETGVILAEYRNTLHERFGKIHEQMGTIDTEVDKHSDTLHKIQTVQAKWQSNIKVIIAVVWIAATISSTILTNFGGAMLRAIVSHS